MARRKTVDELLQEAEEGRSGGTLGEAAARLREQVPGEEPEGANITEIRRPLSKSRYDKKAEEEKQKGGLGRRLRRTILNPFRGGDEE